MEIRSEGFRVYLKMLGAEDADDIARNGNDEEIAMNAARIGEFPFPYTFEHALSFIASALERQDAGMEMHFGIRLDNETIGACALLGIDREKKTAELGYWIGRRYWGMGYAKEALRILVKYGFEGIGLKSVSARMFKTNERSIRLVESLGFAKREDLESDEVVYGRYKNASADRIGLQISGD